MSWFTSTTHVANAMGANIYARATSEKWQPVKRNYATDTKGEVGINAGYKAIAASATAAHSEHNNTEEVYKAVEDGFVCINPGDFVPFEGARLFITVLTKDRDFACMNYQVPKDRSIIVKGEHGIVLAEYESLWIDDSGNKYQFKRA